MKPEHIVIFSHGFGVRQDSRGMFTDVAAALPYETVLFDYNQYDQQTNTLTVAPLKAQAEKLRQVLANAQHKHPNAYFYLVCHSQGSLVAAMLKPEGIRRTLMIGPPAMISVERMAKVFGQRPGAHWDTNAESSFPRRDGSTTKVPAAYWKDLKGLDPIALYNDFARVTAVTIIHAKQDEIIGSKDYSGLDSNIKNIYLEANHDFTGAARPKLVQTVLDELEERITIVNDQDEVVGSKPYTSVEQNDIYRATGLWVTNSAGDILLAQRSFKKKHDPGKWGPAAAGTVDEGESYEENIIKEAEEELGLTGVRIAKGPKVRITGEHNYFAQWFTAVVDKSATDFKFQELEIEQIKWFKRDELLQEINKQPDDFLKSMEWAVKQLSAPEGPAYEFGK